MDNLTVEQVAELLKISTKTVRRRIISGKMQASKLKIDGIEKYLIPAEQFNTAFEVQEVAQITRAITPVEFKKLLEAILEPVKKSQLVLCEQNELLREEILNLRKQLQEKSKKGYTRSWNK